MAKHIIKELRLDEISAVDSPAQEGARMTIMKRRKTEEEVLTMKATEGYDALTNAIAQTEGISKAQAGIQALERVPGLYDVYKREKTEAANPGVHERIAKKQSAEAALKVLAEAEMRKASCSLPLAYVEVLKTAEGKRLYAQARVV